MRAISVSLSVRFVLAVLPPFPCLECFRLEIYAELPNFCFPTQFLAKWTVTKEEGGHTCLGNKYGLDTTQIC